MISKPFFSNFPSIGQFRDAVGAVKTRSEYVGKSPEGQSVYDSSRLKPTIKFTGTVKLHGTNAGVGFSDDAGIWAQSRNNLITPLKDNAYFASFVDTNRDAFFTLMNQIKNHYSIDTKTTAIFIFGEWAGKGVQKGVAISELERFFVIFAIKVVPAQGTPMWLSSNIPNLKNVEKRIFNIFDFKTYSIDIDFNRPDDSTEILNAMTEEVDKECPFGKAFGVTGPGEGIVFIGIDNGDRYIFKSKGESHRVVNTKKNNSSEVDQLSTVTEFVNYAVTENRLNQGIEVVFTKNGQQPSLNKTKEFCCWMTSDIRKEESDTIYKNLLYDKQVVSAINKASAEWLKNKVLT